MNSPWRCALVAVAASVCAGGVAAEEPPGSPYGLLANFRKSPAIGITATPVFSWVVPPCSQGSDHEQVAFSLRVLDGAVVVWSVNQSSPNSTNVPYGGPELRGGTRYTWSVTTWTQSAVGAAAAAAPCMSSPSAPAVFVTALTDGWAPSAKWIWSGNAGGTYAFLRKTIMVPAGDGVVSAFAFATAKTDDYILCGYKLYLDGALIGVGPGRGEAPVWGANGTYMKAPYAGYDVTASFTAGQTTVAAVQGLASTGKGGPGGGVLLQIVIALQSGKTMVVATDETWEAFDADRYFHPGLGHNWYAHKLENTDARDEPAGWRLGGNATAFGLAKTGEAAVGAAGLWPKMAEPVEVHELGAPPVLQRVVNFNASLFCPGASVFFADFGREFQGGIRLGVTAAVNGQRVVVVSGESRERAQPKNKTNTATLPLVGDTWGYNFTWVLRSGPQTIEQHAYMEFRYLNLVFCDGAPPTAINLTAWQVQLAWDPADSHFVSSNATLNAVWELARYTVQAGLLDTYTDSNTRERRPYEADGLVAATSRLWVQRDFMWARHSHSYVIEHPTWPVEWVQISALLAYADYWATGAADLGGAYLPLLLNNTRLKDADSTGLLNCSAQVRNGCAAHPGNGHHIIDWFPGPSGSMFHSSEHTSVNNAFCLRGLKDLAQLAGVLGRSDAATDIAAKAAALSATMMAKMWGGQPGFCDGICSEVNHSGVTTAAWTLFNDLVPTAAVPAVWKVAADWGAEGFGDYGVFIFLSALNKYAGDDGSAMVKALTKCDTMSWCNEIKTSNATMTRESWVGGTYSHPWGTGAVTGVAGGVMGIVQTSPGFATFEVKPRLGSIASATIAVPTLMGPINVTAGPTSTVVAVPCSTRATVCVLHRRTAAATAAAPTVLLDGELTAARLDNLHVCVDGIGCGTNGQHRTVALA